MNDRAHEARREREPSGNEVAVVGMAGRFPGARSVDELWENLLAGRESITRFDDDSLRAAGVTERELASPDYVRASPTLEGVDLFDADFFRISPSEARFLDPQHRLFLECAYEALEDAACDPTRTERRIGVFAGASVSTYLLRNLQAYARTGSPDLAAIMFGNAGDFLPTRLSYKLDLTGPSVNIQTACSSSLVAVHFACQNLLAGESDVALAGGVTVQVPQTAGYLFDRDSILSPDGRCRPFDAQANGTVFGSGLGIVVLKRLEDALSDGDRILAVILGSAVNNDGSGGKMGYMAPSIAGQTRVLKDALSVADVPPSSIGYIEAHGTGTALGDPIEIASLAQAYGGDGGAKGSKRCALGASKANVGHLDIAAGILGFIKTVLVLQRGRIPPVAGFQRPNPALELDRTPFFVPTTASDWPADPRAPRRASVSSLGIGGTNAHVVLEQAPAQNHVESHRPELLLLSARSRSALDAMTERLAAHLEAHGDLCLGDVAHTLARGRTAHEHRRCLAAASVEEAVTVLRTEPRRVHTARALHTTPRIAFMFPGQGSQHVGMARALFESDREFRADVESLCGLVEKASGERLLDLVYPATAESADPSALAAAQRVQLAVLVFNLAMARFFERLGVVPDAVVGHSLGELAAAHVAGVLSLEDVLEVVAKRSRAMASSAPGAMIAVPLGEREAVAIGGSGVDLAAINGEAAVVLSGPTAAIEHAERAFAARAIETTRLDVSRANHSRAMDGAVAKLRDSLSGTRLDKPRIPIISTVTGKALDASDATDPGYWAEQIRRPVRFADAIATLKGEGPFVFLEVGPGHVLSALVKRMGGESIASLPSPRGKADPHSALAALGALWTVGADVDLERLDDGRRRHVALPTYPFQRKRHWVDPPAAVGGDELSRPAPRADDDEDTDARDGYVAPSTDTERVVAGIFEDLLAVKKAGLRDDFFELGGHSLLAMRMVTALRKKLGVHLKLEAVFDAATVEGVARAIDGATQAAVPSIPVADRKQPLPLSFSQERLFFLDQLEPGLSAYNITLPIRVRGVLDELVLARALEAVVAHHESLRSRFLLEGGSPTQRHDGPTAGLLEVDDASGWDDARMSTAIDAEMAAPFELARGPLLRARVLRRSESERWLLLSMHHIVTDGWSFNVLLRDLSSAYRAIARGTEPLLAPLAAQYGDFAAWQRTDPEGRGARDLEFFRMELEGAPLVLELPTDHPRPHQQSFAGSSVDIAIPGALLDKLESLAKERATTLFNVLLASFFAWLSQHTHQRDIVVGTTVAGRNHPATEDLIGLFINALPIRATWSEHASFAELIDEVKARARAAFEHQDVPFERLVRELGRTPDLSRPPIFQVDFLFNNFSADEVLSEPFDDGLSFEAATRAHPAAKYDLTLEVVHAPGSIRCRFDYASALFEPSSVEAMAARWVATLERMAASPSERVTARAIVVANERTLLEGWQGTGGRRDGNLTERFERQCAATPSATAIGFGDESITYAALQARVHAMATGLADLGVRPGGRVAIDGTPTPDLVAAMLATLRLGAAYVPFDPSAPDGRVDGACDEARVTVLVSSSPDARRGLRTPVVGPTALRAGGERAGAAAIHPETVAYVIYTSGTTGRPKGVVIPHGAAASYVDAFIAKMRLGVGDRVAQIASLSFDLSVEEVFSALTSGATLVIWPRDEALDEIFAWARASKISLLDLPTPLWHEMVDRMQKPDDVWPELRHIIIGADKVDPRRVARFRALAPHTVSLHDTYGPTEATIVASWARLSGAAPERGIGKPVDGCVVRVLTPDGQLAPPLVHGEICIAGAGVAHGYLTRPALTAENFVPDPLASGARLYRTGDVGRWTLDGDLEIFGRTDHQIKLRGYRIELGEIEAGLRELPHVRDCVVVLSAPAGRERFLAAYLVLEEGSGDGSDIAEALRARLPDYMIPRHIACVAELPRTERGKIDRARLPAPDDDTPAGDFDAPRTETEERVAMAYRDVLGVDAVSATASFFALGGNSLSAMRLVGRLREAFAVALPMTSLFEAPTVRQLARKIEGGPRRTYAPVPRLESRQDARLSFAQERLYFLEQLLPGGAAYHITMAFRVRGALDEGALARAIEHAVARHEVLRAVFSARALRPTQRTVDLLAPVLSVEEAPGIDDARIAAEAAADARRPFSLERGPLLRARLLRIAGDDHALVFTMHHIVSDGWSMGILIHEIGAAYAAYAHGRDPQLPELPIQYADFAAWQAAQIDSERVREDLAFFRHELQAAPLVLELPTDHPRPALATSRGAVARTRLPASLVQRLESLAHDHGATLYMVLLAAYFALVARYARTRDVVIGTPVAGRTHPDTERLVGMFVNSLPIRARWDQHTTFTELLGEVRRRLLGAFEHQDVPLARLVEELQPERDTSRTPIFQTLFVLQNAPEGAHDFGGGLDFTQIPVDPGTAQLELALDGTENRDGTLSLALTYNTDLFEQDTAARMLARYETLLASAADAPSTEVARVRLDREHPRPALTHSRGPRKVQRDQSLSDRLAAWAESQPGATAVRHVDRSYSFAEWERRTNQLARRIAELGARPGVVVGVSLDRSAELVCAVWAARKSGAGYVALDPDLPDARLASMVDDAGVSIVLTSRDGAARWAGRARHVVTVDLDAAWHEESHPLLVAEHGASPSFVLFTSGSTGRPKGVVNTVTGMRNRLEWGDDAYPIGPGDRVIQKTPYSFDVSVWELFGPLAAGATLEVAQAGGHRDPRYLVDLVESRAVTVCHFVPSMLTAFLDELRSGEGRSLRRVVASGEALTPEHVSRFREKLPNVELVNLYGPTEASIEVTHQACGRGTERRDRVPLGKPVANTDILVCDDAMDLVEQGLVGELCIAGTQLARGYLGRADLTAERFVPNPYSETPGARMYRTGDLARWNARGELEYLGRIDHQVKLRGFRVELGEIETHLRRQPGVKDAVVTVRTSGGADRQHLAAYVVAEAPDREPSTDALRDALALVLPSYMIPASFTLLEALPLTTSGKVDRKALPAPARSVGADAVAPRTDTERAIAAIFESLLSVDSVGVHDDFFALGGHSLMAMQLVARVEESLAKRIGVMDVFAGPTVEALARLADVREVEEESFGEAEAFDDDEI